MRHSLSVSVLMLIASAPNVDASIIYEVSASVPNQTGPGDIDLMGSITTDDTIGALVPGNFLDWSLTFDSVNGGMNTLTPLNSSLIFTNSMVSGDGMDLIASVHGSANPTSSSFGFRHDGGFPFGIVYSVIGGAGVLPSVRYENTLNILSNDDFAEITLGGSADVPFVFASAAIPEPSSILFSAIGMLVLGVAGVRSHRKRLGKQTDPKKGENAPCEFHSPLPF